VPQATLPPITPTWLKPDHSLDTEKLLEAFLSFWRQHGEPLLKSAPYHEIAPHLVLMAFLHRVVNAGGPWSGNTPSARDGWICARATAERPWASSSKSGGTGPPTPSHGDLEQIDGYLQGLGRDTGWLVIFDRRSGRPPVAERTAAETAETPSGKVVAVVRA